MIVLVTCVFRMQTAVGLCLSAAVWRALPRIHPMGRPGQPGVQGGRPQWTGTSVGEPEGERLPVCVVSYSRETHKFSHNTATKIAGLIAEWRCTSCCVILFNRTETTWPMRKCPVRCGTTTSWTSSKRNEDKSSSLGVCFSVIHLLFLISKGRLILIITVSFLPYC